MTDTTTKQETTPGGYESDSKRSPFDPVKTLHDLLGSNPTARTKRRVADALAKRVNRLSFHQSYIENAASGWCEISPDGLLYKALYAVWDQKQSGHPIKGAMVPVTVYVFPGTVDDGSILRGESEICPHCGEPFFKINWNQIYCNPLCRIEETGK
jgi:hypothetical protein